MRTHFARSAPHLMLCCLVTETDAHPHTLWQKVCAIFDALLFCDDRDWLRTSQYCSIFGTRTLFRLSKFSRPGLPAGDVGAFAYPECTPLRRRYKLNRIQLPTLTTREDYEAGKTDYWQDALEKVYSKHLLKCAAASLFLGAIGLPRQFVQQGPLGLFRVRTQSRVLLCTSWRAAEGSRRPLSRCTHDSL
jgi:hypothetical protein